MKASFLILRLLAKMAHDLYVDTYPIALALLMREPRVGRTTASQGISIAHRRISFLNVQYLCLLGGAEASTAYHFRVFVLVFWSFILMPSTATCEFAREKFRSLCTRRTSPCSHHRTATTHDECGRRAVVRSRSMSPKLGGGKDSELGESTTLIPSIALRDVKVPNSGCARW